MGGKKIPRLHTLVVPFIGPVVCVRGGGGGRAAAKAEIQARTDLKTSVSGLVLKAKLRKERG